MSRIPLDIRIDIAKSQLLRALRHQPQWPVKENLERLPLEVKSEYLKRLLFFLTGHLGGDPWLDDWPVLSRCKGRLSYRLSR